MQKDDSQDKMTSQRIKQIAESFKEYSENEKMSYDHFKKSMGLLAIGQAETISQRIFNLINSSQPCSFFNYLNFLNLLSYGSIQQKAQLSFNFLDRSQKEYISHADIEIIINQVSFLWNFLTDQKLSMTHSIQKMCNKLNIKQNHPLRLQEHKLKYTQLFDWFDFFNEKQVKPQSQKQFSIDKVQQYLRLVNSQLHKMIGVFKPHLQQPLPPRGDSQFSQSQLSQDFYLKQQQGTPFEMISNKLKSLAQISSRAFDHHPTVVVVSAPKLKSQLVGNQLYFGHRHFNLMINMMLGIRKSLKSYFFPREHPSLTEEDLVCKYMYELIYKKYNKSIKPICEIFVDYAPKIFYYVRKHFQITNEDYIRSMGLENLIGSLIFGTLSTFFELKADQNTFIFHTEDNKLVVKSIQKEEYIKLKSILENYLGYVRQNRQTMLPKIYGLYKMKNKQTNRQIYFIVMENLFNMAVEEEYQIIGSTYGREALGQNSKDQKNNILLDMDLIKKGRVFKIDKQQKQKYLKQIKNDAQFLAENQIIEYSLAIGINKQQNYYFGIVNILQNYSAKKVFENHFFHLFNADVAALQPYDYYFRLMNFIKKHIFTDIKE